MLDKVNVKIYENEITTVIGKSGTGKSVLLKHMIGLLQPDEGAILFEGKPLDAMKKSEWEDYRSRIAYLFQNNALLDSMTVFENVASPSAPDDEPRARGRSKRGCREDRGPGAREAVHRVSLQSSPGACRSGWPWRGPS